MKQRIDHTNYEAWLLDRLEGNLLPEHERELAAFLALHPELDPGEGELPTVVDQEVRLGALDKEALKRRLPPVATVDPLNVEDHLIARLENDLSQEQMEALRMFLFHHPEHRRTEDLYALTKLVPEAMAFAQKQELTRTLPPQGRPTRFTLDDFLVARLEGELTPEQDKALTAHLATDAAAQRSWKLMQAARVEASVIAFPYKQELKKGGRVIAITSASWPVRLAAAASIALLLGMSWWWWTRPTSPGEQVAETGKEIVPAQGSMQQNGVKDSLVPKPVPVEAGSPENRLPIAVQEQEPRNEQLDQEQQQPSMVPPLREEPLPIAEQRNPVPPQPLAAVPQNVPVPEVPVRQEEALAANVSSPGRPAQQPEVNTLGEALAATLRERVLDQPVRDVRPLDGNDAVAAVDRGLKAVGGERAGLSVARDDAGRNRGFSLRLGRNLAISASR